MDINKFLKHLDDYTIKNNLKKSKIRNEVLEIFLNQNKHLTVEELFNIVKKNNNKVGIATIYRCVDVFCKAGICKELFLDDGITRYEITLFHEHHDHLICTECGKFVEIYNEKIEKLQEKIAADNGFILKRHKLDLYGICKKCQK